eukprot:UN18947
MMIVFAIWKMVILLLTLTPKLLVITQRERERMLGRMLIAMKVRLIQIRTLIYLFKTND